MNNKSVVIDAGHGGNDPGSSGNGIIEKNLTLQISQYMDQRLRELGIPVKMTRTTDETLSPDERIDRVLGAYGNNKDVIVISNHINSGGGEGAEVIYALRNTSTLPDLILEELTNAGQTVRDAYQRRLPTDPSKDYYFMQRETGITEPVTVEYGFLDNPTDATDLKNNWRKYAEAVVKAVLKYIKGTYVPTTPENIYIVQSGDSLWTIAKKYNVTVDQLKSYNNLTTNLLKVGQELKIPIATIPIPTGEYKTYTVMPGDTLYSIARNNNLTAQELIEYNKLTSSTLTVGQQLLIPISPTTGGQYTEYTVKSGDSLYSIANEYGITVDAIKSLNNLTTNTLSIGQVLKIPTGQVPPSNYIEYTIKSGDSLYDIARKYNTTVQNIMSYNNLTSNLLSIGQVIRIPTTTQGITYTVKSGDNLYDIAAKYNTTADEIKRKNNLTSNLLQIGQTLII